MMMERKKVRMKPRKEIRESDYARIIP
jgi:hypothetical protein